MRGEDFHPISEMSGDDYGDKDPSTNWLMRKASKASSFKPQQSACRELQVMAGVNGINLPFGEFLLSCKLVWGLARVPIEVGQRNELGHVSRRLCSLHRSRNIIRTETHWSDSMGKLSLS